MDENGDSAFVKIRVIHGKKMFLAFVVRQEGRWEISANLSIFRKSFAP